MRVEAEGSGDADRHGRRARHSGRHRERIFDRFYRVDEGRSRDMGGTGLGLAIAKWAVEANGGQISLEGAATGSVFRITLPRVVRT